MEDDPDTTIVIEGSTEEPIEETSDETVIIVDNSETNPEPIETQEEIAREIDGAVTLALLEERVAQQNTEIWSLEARVALLEAGQEVLAEQDEAIVEATDEAIVESIEEATDEEGEPTELEVPDTEPVSAKVHPLFRPASEWFGR